MTACKKRPGGWICDKLYEWDRENVEPGPELDQAVDIFAKRVIAGKFGVCHDNRMVKIYELIRKTRQ